MVEITTAHDKLYVPVLMTFYETAWKEIDLEFYEATKEFVR